MYFPVKPIYKVLLFLVGISSLISCSEGGKSENLAGNVTIDGKARKVKLPLKINRVMGLAPSMTEVLFAVCPKEKIIGRTQNCNFPPECKNLPVVNNYPIDLESLKALQPDIVFAVEGITSAQDAERIESLGIPVYYTNPHGIEDLIREMRSIGFICGDTAGTNQFVDDLNKKLHELKKSAAVSNTPKVLFIINNDPIYIHGYNTLMSDKLKYASALNVAGSELKGLSPEVTREYILKVNPDIIIGEEWNNFENDFFSRYPELKNLDVYKKKKFFHAHQDLQSRPGPRIIEAVEELCTIIKDSAR